jgi:hypothetical protein
LPQGPVTLNVRACLLQFSTRYKESVIAATLVVSTATGSDPAKLIEFAREAVSVGAETGGRGSRIMKRHFRSLCTGTCLLLTSAFTAVPQPSELQRLQGAWVPEGAQCSNVFFRKGRSINFYRPGASVREGILIERNRLSDARQRCTIRGFKPNSDTYTMLIRCLRGRSLISSTFSFSLRFVDDDTVIRSFREFPEEKLMFHRCKI